MSSNDEFKEIDGKRLRIRLAKIIADYYKDDGTAKPNRLVWMMDELEHLAFGVQDDMGPIDEHTWVEYCEWKRKELSDDKE